MKCRIIAILFFMISVLAGVGYAADEQASLGAQAGETARTLKETANESLSTGATKVAEASQKVEVKARDTVKTLQQEWDEFANQLREKTQQLQKQADQQWQDFNKVFHQPAKS